MHLLKQQASSTKTLPDKTPVSHSRPSSKQKYHPFDPVTACQGHQKRPADRPSSQGRTIWHPGPRSTDIWWLSAHVWLPTMSQPSFQLRARGAVAEQRFNKSRGCVFSSLLQFSSASSNQSILPGCAHGHTGASAADSGRTISFRLAAQTSQRSSGDKKVFLLFLPWFFPLVCVHFWL